LSSKWFLPWSFTTRMLYPCLIFPMRTTCLAHRTFTCLIILILLEESTFWRSSSCSFAYFSVK
jgi:hypothetical protein